MGGFLIINLPWKSISYLILSKAWRLYWFYFFSFFGFFDERILIFVYGSCLVTVIFSYAYLYLCVLNRQIIFLNIYRGLARKPLFPSGEDELRGV